MQPFGPKIFLNLLYIYVFTVMCLSDKRRKNSFINRLTLSLYELSEEFIPRGIAWNIRDIIMKMKKRHCCILRVSKYHQYLGNKSKVNLCSFVYYYCTLGKPEGEQRRNVARGTVVKQLGKSGTQQRTLANNDEMV